MWTSLVAFLISVLSSTGLVQLSTGSTYISLSPALLDSNSLFLQATFLDADSDSLSALGSHLDLTLICRNNTLTVSAPLLVPSGTLVNFTNCQLTSTVHAGALMSIMGEVVIEGGGVFALAVPAFLLYGSLALSSARLAFNTQSLFVANLFGLSLLVQNCSFESNSSPAGSILLLSLSASQSASSTNVTILNSHFLRNSAALGGAFLYLNINPALALTSSQLSQSRTLTVAGSRFEANPGVLCLLASNHFLESIFRNNSFTGVQTAFVIKQLSADLTVQASTFQLTHFLAVVSALLAQLTVSDIYVQGISVGPALLILNRADISLGLVKVSGLTIRYCSFSAQTYFSTSIFAVNAAVQADHITVENTLAYAGLAGVYSFSVASIRDVEARNVTFPGSIVFLFFSQADSANLLLSNSTLLLGGFHACYSSTSHMRNLTTDVGVAGYLRKPTPRYNVVVAFSSNVTLLDCHFVVPPVANFPAFYLWRSSLFAQTLTFTSLYANFLNAFDHSNGTVLNVTIGDFNAQSLALVFQSFLRLDSIVLEKGQMKAGAIVALSQAQVHVTRFTLRQGSFEFLISAVQSNLTLASLTFPALSADAIFTYIRHSYIEVSQMTLTDSVFDLTQLHYSQLVLRSVSLSNIRIRRRFVKLIRSSLTLEACTLQNLSATTNTPFCQASKDSTLSLLSTRVTALWSMEQELMHFSDSTLFMRSSAVTHYNGTFIVGESTQISIESSEIREGGLQRRARGETTAGFIQCSACNVALRKSRFEGLSGTNGGVAALLSSSLSMEACEFLSGTALGDGGFVRAVNSNVSITLSQFTGGQASRGGALSVDCTTACQCLISTTTFSWNSALEGGAVHWTKSRPVYISIQASNNSAVYGSFEASIPTHLSLIAAEQAVLHGVADINVVQPILIGFFDAIEQLVTTDNRSSAKLESEHIGGTTSVVSQGGVANFSSILLQAVPGQSVLIQAQSDTINQTFPHSAGARFVFTYETRLCLPGEVTTAIGCYLCPKNTFSVDPSDPECTECPGYAYCPGGKELVLNPGYWRESALSAEVLLCPIPEACEGGGNATCAEGYEEVLCARCSQGYYFTGLHYCEHCELLLVRLIRAGLLCIAAAATCLAFVALQSGLWLASLKVVVEFFQTLLILPSLNVDWGPVLMSYFSFNEMLMSCGLSALTLDCLVANDAPLPPVFIKAIVSTAFPLLALNLIAGVCFLRSREHFLQRYTRCSYTFLWFFHPYMVKSAVSLLSCKKVNGVWLLEADVSVSCYAGEQRYLIAVALIVVLLSVCPFPLLLWKALRRGLMYRQKYVPPYLYAHHRSEHMSASASTVLHRTALFTVLLGLSPADHIMQILCSSAFLYFRLQSHLTDPAHTCQFLVTAEGVSQLAQTYLCACALYFAAELEVSPMMRTALRGVLFALILAFAVGTGALGLRLQRHQMRRTAARNLETDGAASVAPPPSVVSRQSFNSDLSNRSKLN